MKLTVFKSRRGRPSQYLQQAIKFNSVRQPLADMVQNNLNLQENKSPDSKCTVITFHRIGLQPNHWENIKSLNYQNFNLDFKPACLVK